MNEYDTFNCSADFAIGRSACLSLQSFLGVFSQRQFGTGSNHRADFGSHGQNLVAASTSLIQSIACSDAVLELAHRVPMSERSTQKSLDRIKNAPW
jgi:hypothetical protein